MTNNWGPDTMTQVNNTPQVSLQPGESFTLVTRDTVIVCQVVSIRSRGECSGELNECDQTPDVITISSEELLSRARTRTPKY